MVPPGSIDTGGKAVMADRPVIMAVASYRSKAAADDDFDALSASTRPVAAALVEKGADGQLTIDRHRCPAEPVVWCGPVLGSALTVVAAPIGIRFLVPVVDTGSDLGGVSAIAGHFWNNVAKEQLRRMSELLEIGQAALLVVAADATDVVIAAALRHADVIVVASTCADFDQDYSSGIEEARAIG
jgi:hypothetical protein